LDTRFDLVCFSHLRWDFVFQRPHHLLTRFARTGRVFFVEEPLPLPAGESTSRLDVLPRGESLTVLVPRLPALGNSLLSEVATRRLLDEYFAQVDLEEYVLWYYTPMAVGVSRHFSPLATIYDCMDELSAFRGAPPDLLVREAELFRRADLVFTGGQSLYRSKRAKHPSVHLFPSSVDSEHFAQARTVQVEPEDQKGIPGPRLGFFGVLDERLDAELLAGIADLRPDWHCVLIGPTVKIEPDSLPRRPNIHYLGSKAYADLPRYLAGWDVALIPFARNEATRFISPTKTPEYLAAGRPVVSTSIRDVVQPYGTEGLVRIADRPVDFVAAVEAALAEDSAARLRQSDQFLRGISWDRTWAAMHSLVRELVDARVAEMSARSVLAV